MYKEIQQRKISSKEINNPKKDKKDKKNSFTRKKESQKLITNYNNNANTESRTSKKESNLKMNHLNLKNIIRKIDLFAISLSRKTNTKNLIKNKIKKIKNNNKPMINFIKIKTNKNKENLNIAKHSYLKYNSSIKKNSLDKIDNYVNYESLTTSENRYNKKHFLTGYNQKLNKDKNDFETYINNKKNINKLFNIIKNDNYNNKKIIEKNQPKKFRRHLTELGRFGMNSKNSIRNNELQISFERKSKKKNASTKNKNVLIKNNFNINDSNNYTLKKNEKNKRKNIIINDEFKKYILKGRSAPKNKSDITNKKLFLIDRSSKIKPKHILHRENLKKSIPKPINTHTDLKKTKFKDSHSSTHKNNSEILNTMENFLVNTLNSNIKNEKYSGLKEYNYLSNNEDINVNRNISNDFNKVENYYINNALINIRGISIPGKDSKNEMKINQDSYIIKRNINNIKNFNVFGVFDGHGYYGHTISSYLKENIIKKIEEVTRKIYIRDLEYIYIEFKKDNFKLIKNIFVELDTQILNNKSEFDVNLSGSTCNLIIQIGDHIICSNTGDSRAILIYEDISQPINNDILNNYKVFPLSNDCKPNLPIENERILKNGGIISRLKDSNQKEVGPLRVFSKGSFLPGLAMSRSFGDKLGKEIGIIVDPIINEYNLNNNVKYILIASDGVWEFLTNEKIMEIGNKYYVMNDPDNFCQTMLKISTELWERKSRNIDDITLIVIFFTFL